ncbi:MAG: hypothetical protein WC374_10820 [Phycisphaerae bacterium]|jgi:hypothetical protein
MAELLNEKKHTFSGWPMIVAWSAMIIFALHSSTRMVAAGDTWVAMACGRHFINHGVDTVEPFSAYSHKAGPTQEEVAKWPKSAQWITNLVGLETVKKIHPTGWVNQNWLTHVMFYWLTHDSPVADADTYSFDTLVYWKVVLYIIAVICIYYTGRILGANPALSALLACFALFTARSFLDIRPAGFSNMLVAVFLLILALATYRNILYLWLTVPLAVFWCNVHGGYIYVFIILAVFFGLHLLARIPARWTTTLYSIAAWLAIYYMSLKFLTYKPVGYNKYIFEGVTVHKDLLLHLVLLLGFGSILLLLLSNIKTELFYGYHIVSTVIVAMWSFTRFLRPPQIQHFPQIYINMVQEHISGAQFAFMAKVLVVTCLGLLLIMPKDKILRFSTRKIAHVGGVGFVSFIACLIFNPFHLTNFTHTFEISVSKHAEMWRTVHEWHPAFSWSNPVGTGFPFLIMTTLIIGLGFFWIFSRYIATKKQELLNKPGYAEALNLAFGCTLLVFACYIIFVSFSFITVISGFFISVLFAGIILLSIFVNIHLIYALVPVILILFEITRAYAKNSVVVYHGTYVYPFLIIPVYAGLFAAARLFSKRPRYKGVNIVFAAIAAVAAAVLMIKFVKPNPLNIKTISQAGGVWDYIMQYWNIIRPWHPAYESNLDSITAAYDRYLFRGLYIINIVALGLWFLVPIVKKYFTTKKAGEEPSGRTEYNSPKFDLVYVVVAMLTVYMAIASRRFIPIAAFAACPVIAMLISQIARTVSATYSFPENGKFAVRLIPRIYQNLIMVFMTILLAVFTIWFGFKFKTVYLDPWPMDYKLDSVFMRMTASHAKPFYVMDFVKANNLSGKMFNYWTEGGFIAYGQTPDPNTGKTPLQLFMDGRAQAAYQPEAFKRWQKIMTGTRVGEKITTEANARGQRNLTAKEYQKIGQALSNEFRKENVWVVLMPLNVKGDIIIESMKTNPEWVLVFYNDKEKLWVDSTTKQGDAVVAKMLNGILKYPDEFSRRLSLAHFMLTREDSPQVIQKGIEYAASALELNPCQQAMYELVMQGRTHTPIVGTIIKKYVDDFIENEEKYKKQNGYIQRLAAAAQGAGFLANAIGDKQERIKYLEKIQAWPVEAAKINETMIW